MRKRLSTSPHLRWLFVFCVLNFLYAAANGGVGAAAGGDDLDDDYYNELQAYVHLVNSFFLKLIYIIIYCYLLKICEYFKIILKNELQKVYALIVQNQIITVNYFCFFYGFYSLLFFMLTCDCSFINVYFGEFIVIDFIIFYS